MTVRLYHPETDGEFDAHERSVPTWQRAGWVVKAEWKPPAVTAPVTSSNGNKAATTAAQVTEKE